MPPDKGNEIIVDKLMSSDDVDDDNDDGDDDNDDDDDDGANNIQQFRERMAITLSKYPSYDTIFTLERWLHSYNNDIEEAAEQMKRALYSIDAIGGYRDYDSAESLNNFLRTLNGAVDYFPGGIMGPDKYGNIVTIQPMGRARPATMMRLGRVSDLYRTGILEAEACMCLLRKEEAKRGCKLGIILISDLAELSRETIFMPAVKAYMNVLSIIQYFFPDSIKKVYVINAPSAINFIFNMAKRVLSERVIENIEFLGADWKQTLRNELGVENIFKHWGGTKEAESETGTIRMGGEVPIDMKEEIMKTLKFIPDDQLTKATITAGEALEISFNVPQSNSLLQWYFTVSNGDIDFSVINDGEEVWPLFRLSTEYVPEYGELICHKAGTYIFHFISTAKLFSKTIAYNISVKVPEDSSQECSSLSEQSIHHSGLSDLRSLPLSIV